MKVAKRASQIFTEDQVVFLHTLYISRRLPPATCVEKLNEKFGSTFTRKQVYGAIENRGWAAKRRMLMDRATTAIAATESNGAIVAKIKRNHAKAMDEFVESSEAGARRAFEMVKNAGSARELSAAAAAASSLIRTYRLCAGIDGASSSGSNANVFNFNFGSMPMKDAPEPAAEVVDV